jgi:hypothetical protein
MIRCLIVPVAVAALAALAGPAFAQGAFPAPLPSGAAPAKSDPAFPPVNGGGVIKNDPAFPPVNGAQRSDPAFPPVHGTPSAFPSNGAAPVGGFSPMRGPQEAGPPPGGGAACMDGFMPLRKEAEHRGNLIKKASERHAPASEACKLIGNFAKAEVKMIKYVQSHQQQCNIPPQVAEQLQAGHKNTEKTLRQVCNAARQQAEQPRGPAGPSLSEALGATATLPEAKASTKGGSTFDTLTGNVLTR